MRKVRVSLLAITLHGLRVIHFDRIDRVHGKGITLNRHPPELEGGGVLFGAENADLYSSSAHE